MSPLPGCSVRGSAAAPHLLTWLCQGSVCPRTKPAPILGNETSVCGSHTAGVLCNRFVPLCLLPGEGLARVTLEKALGKVWVWVFFSLKQCDPAGRRATHDPQVLGQWESPKHAWKGVQSGERASQQRAGTKNWGGGGSSEGVLYPQLTRTALAAE